jgi:hypothetical protein
MKTLLDEFHTSFLHAVIYVDSELHIIVTEGFRSDKTEDLTIGSHVIKDTFAIDKSERSRFAEVIFNSPIAWQLVDESFTSADKYELRADRFALQVLTQSRYLDYVLANHGWFRDVGRGEGKHYRVWTENEVVDVVACEPPTIKPYERRTAQPKS